MPFLVVPEERGSQQCRPLGHPPAALEAHHQQLSRLVLRLDEPVGDVVEHEHPQGSVAVRGVGQLGPAQGAHDPREDAHARLAEQVRRGVLPQAPGRHDEVGLVVDQGLQHDRDLRRVVLTVGVERHHELRSELDGQRIPHPERVAMAEVLREHEGDRTGLGAPRVGVVVAAVDDHHRGQRQAAGLGRHGIEHGADVVLLLEGADEADDGGELQVGVPRHELLARLAR